MMQKCTMHIAIHASISMQVGQHVKRGGLQNTIPRVPSHL